VKAGSRTRRSRPSGPGRSSVAARDSARHAGLRYVSIGSPGLRRSRQGGEFRYFTPKGKLVRDPAELRRIKALAVPPAWTDVWICPDPAGHIQATGRDARSRRQYRYHKDWRLIRDENKYQHMLAFGQALPRIRRRVRRDLRQDGLGRDKVVASVVRWLELSAARIGSQEYKRSNGSYGLTTLQDRHIRVHRSRIEFRFRGKGGKEHRGTLDDPRLARIVKRCQDIPGQDLFQYIDENGETRCVTSADVNSYLARVTGQDFTAKAFRTWTGTVQAALALCQFQRVQSQRESRRNIVQAIEHVAQVLGNTPAICRKCYIHPAILEAYPAGELLAAFRHQTRRSTRSSPSSLRPEEAAVLALLRQHLKPSRDRSLREKLARSLSQLASPAKRRRLAQSKPQPASHPRRTTGE
jgi:DNA topoisomerase I